MAIQTALDACFANIVNLPGNISQIFDTAAGTATQNPNNQLTLKKIAYIAAGALLYCAAFKYMKTPNQKTILHLGEIGLLIASSYHHSPIPGMYFGMHTCHFVFEAVHRFGQNPERVANKPLFIGAVIFKLSRGVSFLHEAIAVRGKARWQNRSAGTLPYSIIDGILSRIAGGFIVSELYP